MHTLYTFCSGMFRNAHALILLVVLPCGLYVNLEKLAQVPSLMKLIAVSSVLLMGL